MYIHTNSFTFLKSFEIIIMIVIGGLGSITGSVLGAVLFIALTEGLRRVRAVPDGALLAAADRHHDRAAAGDPRPPRVRDVPDAAAPADRRGARHDRENCRAACRSSSSPRVTMRFGGLVAVNELDLTIAAGPALRPDRAQRRRQDHRLQRHHRRLHADRGRHPLRGRLDRRASAAGRITRRGIARTFQNIRLFAEMSVLDNVKVAFDCRQATTLATRSCGRPLAPRGGGAGRRARAASSSRSSSSTSSPTSSAKNLPYGSQRRLEIARALATAPRLLLLDEPAAGMNPHESNELMDLIRWVRDQFGMTILLVEHNMKVVMGICETVHVLDYGATIAIGTPGADPARTRRSSRPTWGARERARSSRSATSRSPTARSRRSRASRSRSTRARSSR